MTYQEFLTFFLATISDINDAENLKNGIYVGSEVFRTFYLVDQGELYRGEKSLNNRFRIEFTPMGDGVYWARPAITASELLSRFGNK
jgi:hypothetical protein